jgi:hypothetical protein
MTSDMLQQFVEAADCHTEIVKKFTFSISYIVKCGVKHSTFSFCIQWGIDISLFSSLISCAVTNEGNLPVPTHFHKL